MEKSKLPVFKSQTQKSSDLVLPCAKKPCPQKPVLPLYSKDPNIVFSATVPNFTMPKGGSIGKKPVPSKKTVPLPRGLINRQKIESELRDQNQLLEAVNNTLQNKLLGSQSTIQEMTEKHETMQDEMKTLKQRLEKNLIIMEGRNIDPVAGEQILADAEESCKIREETKTATENLLKELKVFSSETKEQKKLVQSINSKWKEAEESREQFLEEQKAFQADIEKFRSSLEQTEKWLDL